MSYSPADHKAWIFADTAFVAIRGEITPDDIQRFNEIAQQVIKDHPKDVWVVLSGPGGNLIAGYVVSLRLLQLPRVHRQPCGPEGCPSSQRRRN